MIDKGPIEPEKQPVKEEPKEEHIKKPLFTELEDNRTLESFLGNKETMNEIKNIYAQIAHNKLYDSLGSETDKSFLLYGPPGNGKTHSLYCLAGEFAKHGLVYPLMDYSIGTKGTAYINMGSVNLQKFFDMGKKIANCGEADGVLYFFDEADVIMKKRGGYSSHKEDDKLLETLMKNLQRIHTENSNEYCFFTTNLLEVMDTAALRSKRVDQIIKFDNPNLEARIGLFENSLKNSNEGAGYEIAKGDTYKLAKLTEGFNCADCMDIVRKTIKSKITALLVGDNKNIIGKIDVKQKEFEDEIYGIQKNKSIKRKIGFT